MGGGCLMNLGKCFLPIDYTDFCCTFAMSLMILLVLICSTKVSEKFDMTKS